MTNFLTRMLGRQDFYTGLATMLVGAVGLWDIAHGNWRPGPGIGPHAFPQMAYIALVIAGFAIWVDVARGKSDERPDQLRVTLFTGVALVAAGMGMFWLAGKLGLGVSVLIALMGASFLLTREPLKHWPSTIVVPVVASVVIWVLFVRIINVPLPRGLLF